MRGFSFSQRAEIERRNKMIIKGYPVESGYMGYVDGNYILFATEDEYLEFIKSRE